MVDWHSLSVTETLFQLKSSAEGLTAEEAKKRMELYGTNELKEAKRRSKKEIFLSQFRNFLVAVLVIASLVSFVLGEILDGSAILAIVILNSILGYVQENKAERALEALKKMAAPQSVALRNSKKILVDSKMLVPGDIIFLESGSKVPADCRIIEEMNLKIDESILTGESKPGRKQAEAVSKDSAVADRKCMAFSGTTVVYGRCSALVAETGMKTEFGRIAQQLSEPDEETPLQKKLDVLGKQLGMMILVVCAVVFAVGFLRNNPVLEMFLVAVSLAVAAIPEGLPAVVTITLAIGLMRMSRKRALMRNLPASETLGSATVVCVPGNTSIACDSSIKDIDSVKEGDKVLGLDGLFHEVLRTYKRNYTGNLIHIKPIGLPWLKITPEHPILIAKVKKSRPLINRSRPRKTKIISKSWVNASDVKKGDMVLIPRIKEEKPYIFRFQRGREKKEVEVELDEEVAELFGWYLAEGCTSIQKGSYHIMFYLGKNEPENIKRVCYLIENKLGLKTYVYQNRTAVRIVIINRDLVQFLMDNFGSTAKNKRIPIFILKASKGIVSKFLYGYLKGDGRIDDYYIRFTTTSKTVAYQLIVVLAKLGIRGRLHKRKGGSGVIEGRNVHISDSYEVFVSGTQASIIHQVNYKIRERKNNLFLSDENFVYVPIRNVRIEKKSLDVFNIETSSQNYSLPFVVHNCSDKTGTITQNKMTVEKIFFNEKIFDIEKKYDDNSLFEIGVLCNDAPWPEDADSNIGDPTETALLVSAKKHGIGDIRKKYKRISEIPFESSRKMMSVVCVIDKEKKAMYTKGAVESVMEKCTHIYKGHGAVRINDKERKHILAANAKLSQSALRVLAFAYKHCDNKSDEGKEEDLIFVGLQGMIDPPRPEVKDAISMCTKAGIKVVMITGDHKETAVAIAKEIGMDAKKVVTGTELDSMNDASFEKIVEDISVYARVSPEHKVRITEALRKNGHIVAMTGDGVNDAPALKKADIGIAVGSGTDVTKEAADMVLTDDNFATVISAVEEGRTIYENIKKFVYYLLSANLGEVLVVFGGILIGWPIVLLPLMLLWINILTDGLPALALGVEPPDAGSMSRPPRDPRENILNKKSLAFIAAVATIMAVGTLLQFYSELPGSMDANGVGSLALARTSAFTEIVLFELLLALSMRSQLPLHKIGLLSNKKMILALLSSFVLHLAVIYTPLNVIFGTAPLGIVDWIEIAAVSLSILVILEAWKTLQLKKKG